MWGRSGGERERGKRKRFRGGECSTKSKRNKGGKAAKREELTRNENEFHPKTTSVTPPPPHPTHLQNKARIHAVLGRTTMKRRFQLERHHGAAAIDEQRIGRHGAQRPPLAAHHRQLAKRCHLDRRPQQRRGGHRCVRGLHVHSVAHGVGERRGAHVGRRSAQLGLDQLDTSVEAGCADQRGQRRRRPPPASQPMPCGTPLRCGLL